MFHFSINFDRKMKDKKILFENVKVTTIKIKSKINILKTLKKKKLSTMIAKD